MAGQMDAGTIRRLPDGEPQPARIENGERRQIRITLEGEDPSVFAAGALVEVQSADALYLGEIRDRRDSVLIMSVEHAVNRAALAEIEHLWRKPQGG